MLIVYDDFSKESLVLDSIRKQCLLEGYEVMTLPISQREVFDAYYKQGHVHRMMVLNQSLQQVKPLFKYDFEHIFIYLQERASSHLPVLKTKRLTFLIDDKNIKYLSSLKPKHLKKAQLFYQQDTYAWLLYPKSEFSTLLDSSKPSFLSSKDFKQEGRVVTFLKAFDEKMSQIADKQLLFFFQDKKVLLKYCQKSCELTTRMPAYPVFLSINQVFDLEKKHLELSRKIKKIFALIEENKLLEAHLYMDEKINEFNSLFFKKIFDFISESLYKIEPDLIRRQDGKY